MSSYIDSSYLDMCSTYDEPVEWATFTDLRLRWLYGDNYSAERRAATAADLAAWRKLGSRRAAA